MVAEMSYITVSSVLDSWERVRRIDDYEKKTGAILFTRLFELEPDAKSIFGFKDDLTMEELGKHERFSKHATYFIQMIDKALGMLGPDIELLTEILMDLGLKHAKYGVKPEYFPSMGHALIHAVELQLGQEAFNREIKDAWVEVYGALSYDMIRAQKMPK